MNAQAPVTRSTAKAGKALVNALGPRGEWHMMIATLLSIVTVSVAIAAYVKPEVSKVVIVVPAAPDSGTLEKPFAVQQSPCWAVEVVEI